MNLITIFLVLLGHLEFGNKQSLAISNQEDNSIISCNRTSLMCVLNRELFLLILESPVHLKHSPTFKNYQGMHKKAKVAYEIHISQRRRKLVRHSGSSERMASSPTRFKENGFQFEVTRLTTSVVEELFIVVQRRTSRVNQ